MTNTLDEENVEQKGFLTIRERIYGLESGKLLLPNSGGVFGNTILRLALKNGGLPRFIDFV